MHKPTGDRHSGPVTACSVYRPLTLKHPDSAADWPAVSVNAATTATPETTTTRILLRENVSTLLTPAR